MDGGMGRDMAAGTDEQSGVFQRQFFNDVFLRAREKVFR